MQHKHTAQEMVMNILMLKERLMNKVKKKFYNKEETFSLGWYPNPVRSSSAVLPLAKPLVNCGYVFLECG